MVRALLALALAGLPGAALWAVESGRGELFTVDGLYAASIVKLSDGSLVTEKGEQSFDGGRTWKKSGSFRPVSTGAYGEGEPLGLVRMKNGELGAYFARVDQKDRSHFQAAIGNASNRWFFAWSADEGRSWSSPVPVTLPGYTNGLEGRILLPSSSRLIIFCYSQMIGAPPWGASYGSFKGVRFAAESEGHIPDTEACRTYTSDDNGRTWAPCDGWILAWRDQERLTDSITEPAGVELSDGRVLLVTRAFTGHIYQAVSRDSGRTWPGGAKPTALSSSQSPCAIFRLPRTHHLALAWNQMSRAEIRRGFRRCRLSSAVSIDEGGTWHFFKNIAAISETADRSYIPPDPSLEPIVGANELGDIPDDFQMFNYVRASVVDDRVFIGYEEIIPQIEDDPTHENRRVAERRHLVTRVFSPEWFYQGAARPAN